MKSRLLSAACLTVVIAAGVVGLRNGSLAYTAPFVAALVWELRPRAGEGYIPFRNALIVVMSTAAGILNLRHIGSDRPSVLLLIGAGVSMLALLGLDFMSRLRERAVAVTRPIGPSEGSTGRAFKTGP